MKQLKSDNCIRLYGWVILEKIDLVCCLKGGGLDSDTQIPSYFHTSTTIILVQQYPIHSLF